MAIINKLQNTASLSFGGNIINSNTVDTLLLLAPTLVKTADKLTASIGDTLTYTLTISNLGLSAINNLPITDVLPAGSSYVTDSFSVNGSAATPTLTAGTLTYTIPTIAALGVATVTFQVKVVGGTV